MFAKLLKQEWKATSGMLGILSLGSLGVSLLVTGLMRFESADIAGVPEIVWIPVGLMIFAGFLAILAYSAGVQIMLIARFYKNKFTDEGYLTFTLPVTNHQLLLSSITNTTLNLLIVGVVTAVTVLLIFLLALSAVPDVAVWEELKQVWPEILAGLKQAAAEDAGLLALMAFSSVATFFRQIIQLMLAVTIGALIAKKHKLLAAVGVYYGINMAVSFLTSMVSIYALNNNQPYVFMGIQGIVSAALVAGGYFLMHYLTSRKLNLT